MPNWCNNSTIVSAKTKEELVEFLDFCDQTHTSRYRDWKTNEPVIDENAKGVFWNFLSPLDTDSYFDGDTMSKASTTENVMATIAQEMATGMDWYHWNARNWGTKWDIVLERDEIPELDQRNDGDWYFNWNFQTAWSPAEGAYRAMAKRFPNLEFNYEITEESNAYAGILVYKNGELITEQWVDSPTHADFEELDIPCEECGWADSGNCLDNVDEDVLESELTTTTNN